MLIQFVWDPVKAEHNSRKHGVSFDEASTVFKDPLAVIFDDEEHSDEEHREIIIGHSMAGRLLIVSFVERKPDHVRLISARATTSRERKDYETNT
jgi:uncharacterized DUF497 family protein